MKVSLNWLQEYVSLDIPLAKLVDSLTMLGLEVESVVDRFDYLNDVLVGRIEEVKIHPSSSNLLLCVVNCGKKLVNVVCSDKNISVQMLVPVAFSGTTMPNGIIISEEKIRGCISSAVLCSESDLAIGLDSSGIMLLDTDAVEGQSLKEVLSLSDFVLEINLTPNRSDCLSLIGIAREIAALQGTELKIPTISKLDDNTQNEIKHLVSVDIINSDMCHHYTCRMFTEVNVCSSPFWLKDFLNSVGLKSINVIVDIANFVMLETGQPIHVFDFDLIKGHRIVIDISRGGEIFKTLDGKEIVLEEGLLCVSDVNKPIALSGLIGSMNSGVTKRTNKIIIESAYFNPDSIRKASKSLGITTESSYRFERGIDPEGALKALDRAASLILKLTNGCMVSGTIDNNYKISSKRLTIELSYHQVNSVLGTNLGLDLICSILNSVYFFTEIIENNLEGLIKVRVPSFRVDVTCPEDLIEEVARIYGYKNIPVTFPKLNFSKPIGIEKIEQQYEMKSVLSGLGFSEMINYSFSDINSCERLNLPINDFRRRQIALLNPISSNQSVMRTSLLPASLDTVYRNITKQQKNLMFFEIGRIFISNGEKKLPDEIDTLLALWTGVSSKASWCTKERECDFFDIKGSLEEFLTFLKIKNLKITKLPDSLCYYTRPGHTAQILSSSRTLGLVGEVSLDLLRLYSINQRVFIFEIDIRQLYLCLPESRFVVPIPKFPSISRDATVILDEDIEAGDLVEGIKDLKEMLVENIYIIDVFKGGNINLGMKSVSFRIIYRSHYKTLDDVVVNSLHRTLVNRLINIFNASLPST